MSGDRKGTRQGKLPSEDPREKLARPTAASSAGIPGQERLRVLIANDCEELVERVTTVVTDLGHEVVAHVTDNGVAGARAADLAADLALVALNERDLDRNDRGTHALELISQLVHEARCPVIAVIENENPEFIARAASNGISAYACPIGHDEIECAVNVALGRFLEHRDLEDAFQRRAVIERAKGVLMERNLIDEREAFERLRSHARSSSQPLVDLAEAVLRGHRVLAQRSARPAMDRGAEVTRGRRG